MNIYINYFSWSTKIFLFNQKKIKEKKRVFAFISSYVTYSDKWLKKMFKKSSWNNNILHVFILI